MSEQQWQTIDNAPKDGTAIMLGWTTGHVASGNYERAANSRGIIERWVTAHGDYSLTAPNAPTHWMPLPDPPK